MSSSPYVGSVVRVTDHIYDETVDPRDPADPTTLTYTVTSITGVATTYTYPASVTKTAVGVYYFDHLCIETQKHTVKALSTGVAAGAGILPGGFTVLADS